MLGFGLMFPILALPIAAGILVLCRSPKPLLATDERRVHRQAFQWYSPSLASQPRAHSHVRAAFFFVFKASMKFRISGADIDLGVPAFHFSDEALIGFCGFFGHRLQEQVFAFGPILFRVFVE